MNMEHLPNWLKYIVGILLLIGVPSLLSALAQEHNGYLYQTEEWSILGLPSIVLVWWAFIFYLYSFYNKKITFNQFVDQLVQKDLTDVIETLKKVREEDSLRDFENKNSDDFKYQAKLQREKLISSIVKL